MQHFGKNRHFTRRTEGSSAEGPTLEILSNWIKFPKIQLLKLYGR